MIDLVNRFFDYCESKNIKIHFMDDPNHLTPKPDELMLEYPNQEQFMNIKRAVFFSLREDVITELSKEIFERKISIDEIRSFYIIRIREKKIKEII